MAVAEVSTPFTEFSGLGDDDFSDTDDDLSDTDSVDEFEGWHPGGV